MVEKIKTKELRTKMNKMELYSYKEKKEYPILLKIWRLVNAFFFPWCGNKIRQALLKMFGAKIGKGCLICRGVTVYAPWNLTMGEMVCIGPYTELYDKDKIEIGDGVVVSQNSYLCTASHNISSPQMELVTAPIVIEDNVWIAAKSSILLNVTISEGAVVGACAVVAKSVPAWSVVVGSPAKVVKKREFNGDK